MDSASDVHLSSTGDRVALEDSSYMYIWIGHVFTGPGAASDTDQCTIELLLTTGPLCALMDSLCPQFCAICDDNGISCPCSSLSTDAEEAEILPHPTGVW